MAILTVANYRAGAFDVLLGDPPRHALSELNPPVLVEEYAVSAHADVELRIVVPIETCLQTQPVPIGAIHVPYQCVASQDVEIDVRQGLDAPVVLGVIAPGMGD